MVSPPAGRASTPGIGPADSMNSMPRMAPIQANSGDIGGHHTRITRLGRPGRHCVTVGRRRPEGLLSVRRPPLYSSPPMDYADSILGLVGDTPLVRLSRVTHELGPEERQPLVLAKLEMLNPGGSVKDRIG